ncbi:MAG: hypothetical protein CMD65_00510 [Gammaproteobacteria bacterium]|nr:hypothetical protein [Gammaproteobacteria bacterium]
MKLKDKKNIRIDDNNLLPLVNIIFLLLIFFMMAGIIEKKKDLYNINLATATIESYVEEDKSILYLYGNGNIRLNDKKIKIHNLEKLLTENDKKDLLVAADATITAKTLNKTLEILNKIKVNKLTLLTLKNE